MTAWTRTPGWQGRLSDYLAAAARQPFVLGQMDCALFAAGAVTVMTGSDPAWRFRGRYRTLAGGQRLVRKAGFGDVEELIAAELERVVPSGAGPGDIAAIDTADGAALGIVQGEMIYVRRPDGLGLVGLLTARCCFRVP